MLKIFVRVLKKIFFINNQSKFIVEFVGNPGSGKTTIINHINQIKSLEGKLISNKKESINFIKLIIFITHKNIGLIFITIKFLTIFRYFLFEENKKNLKTRYLRFKKLFLILFRMLYEIYYSSDEIIFVESIFHQLINNEFNKKKFFNKVLSLYGNPKLKLIFLDCSIDVSLNRMIKRGDEIEINKLMHKRYMDSNLTQKYLFKYISKEYRFISNIEKPLKLYSRIAASDNANYLLKKLNFK